jgi:hypothetical protein
MSPRMGAARLPPRFTVANSVRGADQETGWEPHEGSHSFQITWNSKSNTTTESGTPKNHSNIGITKLLVYHHDWLNKMISFEVPVTRFLSRLHIVSRKTEAEMAQQNRRSIASSFFSFRIARIRVPLDAERLASGQASRHPHCTAQEAASSHRGRIAVQDRRGSLCELIAKNEPD